jgi:outer membrane murein-binding lipoprotein Lpp
MKRLAAAVAAVLLAACASGNSERLEKIENKIQGQILKSNRLEEDQQKLAERVAADLEGLRKDVKGFRDELDLLRSQLAAIKKTASGPTGGSDVEAEKATQEEIEYIRRSPKQEETLANAIKRLRPISPAAVPFLLMELKQSMKRADLPVAAALEKVLAGLEPDVVARAVIPELDIKQTRVIAAGVLGLVGHTSAREPLAKGLDDPDFIFRFAVAQALVRLKGPEGKKAIPVLIEALKPIHRDQNILAYDLLKTLTGFTFGYRMFGPDEEKMASAAKWQEWWESHGDTFEFPEK